MEKKAKPWFDSYSNRVMLKYCVSGHKCSSDMLWMSEINFSFIHHIASKFPRCLFFNFTVSFSRPQHTGQAVMEYECLNLALNIQGSNLLRVVDTDRSKEIVHTNPGEMSRCLWYRSTLYIIHSQILWSAHLDRHTSKLYLVYTWIVQTT